MKKLLPSMLVAVLVSCIVCLLCGCTSKSDKKISNEVIVEKLEAVSELTTARLTFNGLLHYEEGKISFLTKKAFFMTYVAEVKAGIDLSAAKVNVSEEKVEIVLPKPGILSIYIDPASLSFYDEKTALFNREDKNDAAEALIEAENDVKEKAQIDALYKMAEDQTIIVLENLCKDLIGERMLLIRFQ